MDWLVAFAGGVAAGLALWPLGHALLRLPAFARWWRSLGDRRRFRRVFGFSPSDDPEAVKLFFPTVDQHITYLRERVAVARKELLQASGERPRSVLDAQRTFDSYKRSKRRLERAERRLEQALEVAMRWGFQEAAAAEARRPAEETAAQPVVSVRRRGRLEAG
jgi:AraC-like DNA-binding protein